MFKIYVSFKVASQDTFDFCKCSPTASILGAIVINEANGIFNLLPRGYLFYFTIHADFLWLKTNPTKCLHIPIILTRLCIPKYIPMYKNHFFSLFTTNADGKFK